MAEPTSSAALHLGAKKRKLQRACDICRRRKGWSPTHAEETPRLTVTPLPFCSVRCTFVSPFPLYRHLVMAIGILMHPLYFLKTGDGPSKPGNRCTNCTNGNHNCAYVEFKVVGSSLMPFEHPL